MRRMDGHEDGHEDGYGRRGALLAPLDIDLLRTQVVLNCRISRWMARDTVWTKSQSPQSLRPPVYSSSSPSQSTSYNHTHTHARTHTNSSVTLHRGPGSLTFQGTGRFVKLSHAMPHQRPDCTNWAISQCAPVWFSAISALPSLVSVLPFPMEPACIGSTSATV